MAPGIAELKGPSVQRSSVMDGCPISRVVCAREVGKLLEALLPARIIEGTMKYWEKFKSFKESGECVELQFMAAAAQRRFAVSNPWGDTKPYEVGIEHRRQMSARAKPGPRER